jgi:hypothetical protein
VTLWPGPGVRAGPAWGQGLSGPEKAELSLAQAAAAVMPPLDWARPLIPVADADGLAVAGELADAEADELAAGELAAAVGEGCVAAFSPE